MKSAFFLVFISFLALTNNGYAQSMNAIDSPCRGVGDTLDQVRCFDRAWKESDAKLNETYAKIKSLLTTKDQGQLERAQRLWIQYRDVTCNAVHDLYEGGTAGPPTRLECLEAETRAREASLQRSYGWIVEKFGK